MRLPLRPSLSVPESPRGELLRRLQQGPQTVEDLAAALGVTANAVRSQLALLGSQGLVEVRGTRKGRRRPSLLYGVSVDGERVLSRAYGPLLLELLTVLERRLPAPLMRRVFQEVGDRLSVTAAATRGQPSGGGVPMAATVLRQLGGAIELEETGGGAMIRAYGCPVADAVERAPEVCRAVERLLARVSGLTVKERCHRETDQRPRCAFELRRARGT